MVQATGARPDGRARDRAQDRTNSNAKPYFYGAGRILGRVSRLYGYSLLLSGVSSLFLTGFSSLPLTKWDDKGGVPRANLGLVSILLKLWIGLAVSGEGGARRADVLGSDLAIKKSGNLRLEQNTTCQVSFMCTFHISTSDPYPGAPHYCQRYAWSGTFAGNLIGWALSICVFTGLPLVLGTNPKFFVLDV